jgi:hypothetical protein
VRTSAAMPSALRKSRRGPSKENECKDCGENYR